eukprot:TRINITY_DN16723_c0_g1_i1.p1 TRINITY_DN16723_c0_g1~~TRINITY_DN16723_c0_g1_i1.p1  ORF type:complete len:186 (+),score=36.82 TRINITY_DN16723_c0_g1_i1:56-613(+)
MQAPPNGRADAVSRLLDDAERQLRGAAAEEQKREVLRCLSESIRTEAVKEERCAALSASSTEQDTSDFTRNRLRLLGDLAKFLGPRDSAVPRCESPGASTAGSNQTSEEKSRENLRSDSADACRGKYSTDYSRFHAAVQGEDEVSADDEEGQPLSRQQKGVHYRGRRSKVFRTEQNLPCRSAMHV